MYKRLIENIASREEGLVKTLMKLELFVLPLSAIDIAKYVPEIAERKGNKLSEKDLDILNCNDFSSGVAGFELTKTLVYGVIGFAVYNLISN